MPQIKTSNLKYQISNKRGFTLIELLVVIAIIAILATIGLIVYSNVQQRARDSKRMADIKAISDSLETHYMTSPGVCDDGNSVGGGQYCALMDTWFSNGGTKVPTDPAGSSKTYCINYNSAGSSISNPAAAWTDGSCTGAGSGWVPVIQGKPTTGSTAWKICALLESNNQIVCISNQQQ